MNRVEKDPQINLLLQSDESQLLEQLGMRAAVVTRELRRSGEIHPKIISSEVIAMGVQDDLKDLGRRILRVWERSAFEIACGNDPADAKTRTEITSALGLGEAATIGALSAALIGIGLMPALAPVVAAILVKKFLSPAYCEFCEKWKSRIGTK